MNQSDAVTAVSEHINPKACFITTDDGVLWRPISGTGCAHFVAHQLKIVGGIKGSTACLLGYPLSVRRLITSFSPIHSIQDLRQNDVWFNEAVFANQRGSDHCGVVSDISYNTAKQKGAQIEAIMITHCSSKQGGVVTNDWNVHFRKSGRFYRLK